MTEKKKQIRTLFTKSEHQLLENLAKNFNISPSKLVHDITIAFLASKNQLKGDN